MDSIAPKILSLLVFCTMISVLCACKRSCFSDCDCQTVTMDCASLDLDMLPNAIPDAVTDLILTNNRYLVLDRYIIAVYFCMQFIPQILRRALLPA